MSDPFRVIASVVNLFDPLGCPIGRVTVPRGNPPLDIGGRRIVVRDRDELDVERILIHRLAELPSDRAGRAATACPR